MVKPATATATAPASAPAPVTVVCSPPVTDDARVMLSCSDTSDFAATAADADGLRGIIEACRRILSARETPAPPATPATPLEAAALTLSRPPCAPVCEGCMLPASTLP